MPDYVAERTRRIEEILEPWKRREHEPGVPILEDYHLVQAILELGDSCAAARAYFEAKARWDRLDAEEGDEVFRGPVLPDDAESERLKEIRAEREKLAKELDDLEERCRGLLGVRGPERDATPR